MDAPTKEKVDALFAGKEAAIAKHIETTHLKKYMQTETVLLDCGRKNYLRLSERFRHEEAKLVQIMTDWDEYLDALDDVIYESELLDVSTSDKEADEHREKRDKLMVKMQETEKRFKALLGEDYLDPEPILNPKK